MYLCIYMYIYIYIYVYIDKYVSKTYTWKCINMYMFMVATVFPATFCVSCVLVCIHVCFVGVVVRERDWTSKRARKMVATRESVCARVCVWLSVCKSANERERERVSARERDSTRVRERERVWMCVCMRICVF